LKVRIVDHQDREVSLDGKKMQSETYKILGILNKPKQTPPPPPPAPPTSPTS
jgi:hypothetical protein